MKQMRNMGGLAGIMGMLPGMGMKASDIEGMVDEDFTNMTKEEFAKKAEEQGMTCK